jgi:Trm5-related predicted tRNA methylase
MEKSPQKSSPSKGDCQIGKRLPVDLNPLEDTTNASNAPEHQTTLPRKKLKEALAEKLESAPNIIIDCDFEAVQKDRELKSMVVQISECLGLNKRAEAPFRIHLTGVHEKLREKLHKQ